MPRGIENKPSTVAEMLLHFTDAQIEGAALVFFKRFCLKQIDNKMLKPEARKEYKLLADKVDSILELRGDKYGEGNA